jgi:hypothetical protein
MISIPPAQADDFTADELAAAAADMERVLEREPQLNDFGYGVFFGIHGHAERQARFQEDRKSIREPRSLAQFIVARKWLRQFDKRKTLCRRGTSYGLKHVASRTIGYVTNGVFIAAAIAEGFQTRRNNGGPNAFLNIPVRAWGGTA